MEEKRRHIRLQTQIPAEFKPLGPDGERFRTLTRDLSVSGIKVPCRLNVGERFQVALMLYGDLGRLSTEGVVVWARQFGSGLVFDDGTQVIKRRLTGFIAKGLRKEPDGLTNKIRGILPLLSENNASRARGAIIDILKILYFRQRRLSKPTLKDREILGAIQLVSFHYRYRFERIVKDGLVECFGDTSEAAALDFYDKRVMGQTNDAYGRPVIVDEDGMRFLYKDKAGDHIVDSQNFVESRAKRLPWIEFVLSHSREIYESESPLGLTYLYVAKMTIPLERCEKNESTYFIVVVKKEKDKKLRFKTAYRVDKYNRFLSIIEQGRPFCP